MQKVKLEDVAEILDNRRVPITASERIKGVYPYYGANGIQDYVNGYIFDDELVLLAEDGGYFGSETKPIAYRVSGKCWVNNHAHVLKAKECINVDYLCYSLMFYDVTSFVNGATRQKLTQKDMRNMLIPLRNFEEQIKIVNTLNLIRDLIEKRKKQIEKLDELVKSRFIEMFGDPIRNEKEWQLITLGEVAEIKIGPFGSLLHKEDYVKNGHPLINPSHIVEGNIKPDFNLTISEQKYNEMDAYHLKLGDVVLGRRGEMGRCAVVNTAGMLCGTGSMIIRPNNKFKAYFLQNILSRPDYKKIIEDKAVGVTMMNLNVSIVSSLQIPLFPIELQNKFAEFVEKVEKNKSAIKNSLSSLETLKKSLMQKYFG